jgi:hypothetical protein
MSHCVFVHHGSRRPGNELSPPRREACLLSLFVVNALVARDDRFRNGCEQEQDVAAINGTGH